MEGSSRSGSTNMAIPEPVLEAVTRTSNNIDEVKANLEGFLSLCSVETLSRIDPLERAQALFLIAKAATTLFALRLRCNGVDPDNHPVNKELERLSLYQEKLQKCLDLSKAPLRPSIKVNPQAAARVIEHSLPDLSLEQRQSMRDISHREGTGINHLDRSLQKKRKYQSSEKQSVRAAAKEFLEKASRELLGDNKDGVKGPLQLRDSDSDSDSDDVIILE